MGVWDYSTTAGNNASVSGQNWAEGQAPSTINDSARKLLADLAEQYQLYGGLLTTAGSANAQTLTPTVAWTAYNDGARLLVQIGNSLTNTGSATLNVSSLGAKTIYKRDGSTTLSAGDLTAGSFYELVYDATVNGFRLLTGGISLDEATAAGSDVASASTVDLDSATGGIVAITGTTTITAVTLAAGNIRFVRFTGTLTLTHGASLVLPGGANITTAAGDWAIFVGDASSVVRCVVYQRAASEPLAFASQTQMEAASSNVVVVTPGRAQYHPGVAKAFVQFTVSGGTVTVNRSHNVTSVTRNDAGDFTIAFTTAFSDANYAAVGMVRGGPGAGILAMENHDTVSRTASQIRVYTLTSTFATADPAVASFVFFGDQ